jgi:hypothetical protein
LGGGATLTACGLVLRRGDEANRRSGGGRSAGDADAAGDVAESGEHGPREGCSLPGGVYGRGSNKSTSSTKIHPGLPLALRKKRFP